MLNRSPMKRGTKEMKRTAFVSKGQASAPRCRQLDDEPTYERTTLVVSTHEGKPRPLPVLLTAPSQWVARSYPKLELVRSEPYRRLVAAMPCKYCGYIGASQHAHENPGKGMGMKVDDRRGFPLCTVQPGRVGCHELFDQYNLVEGGNEKHAELGAKWAAETRQAIIDAGLWPVRLQLWKEA